MTDIGAPLPSAQLTASDGSSIDLAAATGRPLVLYFYPKADTPGCTTEALDFSSLIGDFDAISARVIGVSRDSVAALHRFVAKRGLSVILASDADGALSDAMGTWVEKSMYGKRYMGMERATFLYDAAGTLVRAWRKVKVKGHAEEVLAAARAL